MSVSGRARELAGRGRRAGRSVAINGTVRLARRLDLAVSARSDIYSPIPWVPPADDPIWQARASLPGVQIDFEAQLVVLERLRPWIEEFSSELRGRQGFEVWNECYRAGDAETLYALLRELKPQRVLELGSGYSTLVSAAACAANARDGSPADLIAVDPEPRTDIRAATEGAARFEREDCRELPLERFLELEPGDVLFIDTSHAVKLGSEVNWLVLEVLPRLRPGVWVHFHDVFLPYEYPRYLFELGAYFNEQYLVQAFLTGNPDWQVELALCGLFRDYRERVVGALPSLAERPPQKPDLPYVPAAFWIRRPG